jgi:hypothetical protein
LGVVPKKTLPPIPPSHPHTNLFQYNFVDVAYIAIWISSMFVEGGGEGAQFWYFLIIPAYPMSA